MIPYTFSSARSAALLFADKRENPKQKLPGLGHRAKKSPVLFCLGE